MEDRLAYNNIYKPLYFVIEKLLHGNASIFLSSFFGCKKLGSKNISPDFLQCISKEGPAQVAIQLLPAPNIDMETLTILGSLVFSILLFPRKIHGKLSNSHHLRKPHPPQKSDAPNTPLELKAVFCHVRVKTKLS